MTACTNRFTPLALASQDVLPALAISNLTNWSLISIIGDDKKSYLHGQVTCDVVSLNNTESTMGSHCDAKGKVWSAFRLFHHNDGYALFQRREAVDTKLAEIKKYSVFSKVDFDMAEDTLLGVTGSEAEQFINNLSNESGDVRIIPGGTAVKVANEQWLLALSEAQAEELIAANENNAVFSTDTLWDLYDIRAALPRIESATINEFIPQALNVQAVGGISFTKGCYTGQETVARAKYRGINKRAMYIVSGQSKQAPKAGDTLERSVGENWRKGGTFIAGYQFSDNKAVGLVVLPNNLDDDTQFRLTDHAELLWQKQPLPYSLDDNE